MAFKVIDSNRDLKIPERNQAFEELLSFLVQATVEVTICILLGAQGGNC